MTMVFQTTTVAIPLRPLHPYAHRTPSQPPTASGPLLPSPPPAAAMWDGRGGVFGSWTHCHRGNLKYPFGSLKKMITFVETNLKMEGQETNDTTYQKLELVYSPILGSEYILVDVEETEEKETS